MNEQAESRSWITPTRVVTALTVCVLLLGGAVGIIWLSRPSVITLTVSEPVGKTVVCHFVVDGRPESREGTVPVTYRFPANEVRYAVIPLDPAPPSDISVNVHDETGTGGGVTSEGVTGVFKCSWWGTTSSMSPMTATHVTTMRKSVLAERRADATSEKASAAAD